MATAYVSGERPEAGDVVERTGLTMAVVQHARRYRVQTVFPYGLDFSISLEGVDGLYYPEFFKLIERANHRRHHEDEQLGGAHQADKHLDSGLAALKDTNPKTRFGQAKPPLGLIPGAALVLVAEALRDGSDKYGPANWREDPVSASTYFSAALRHLFQYWDGEDVDPVSLVEHLAHATTNLMILLDAAQAGTLIDDRPKANRTGDLIRELTRPINAG